MADEWITTAEAAKISGYHIEHIRRLARAGQIKAQKWGKEWMADKISLCEYLKKDKEPGPKPSSKRENRSINMLFRHNIYGSKAGRVSAGTLARP